ncbi:MAG: hypothetical protein ACOCP8_01930 [archaeon]
MKDTYLKIEQDEDKTYYIVTTHKAFEDMYICNSALAEYLKIPYSKFTNICRVYNSMTQPASITLNLRLEKFISKYDAQNALEKLKKYELISLLAGIKSYEN